MESALVVRRDGLPSVRDLTVALAEAGSIVVFPMGFDLGRTSKNQVRITVDGDAANFDYSVYLLADMAEHMPARVKRYGDTLLAFNARGPLAAQAVSLIHSVMAAHWKAAGWIEETLIPPTALSKAVELNPEASPEISAIMQGTPGQRATAIQAYAEKQYPSRKPATPVWVDLLKMLTIPAIIIAGFIAIYIWGQLT